jgi:hypothetical protein
LGFFQSQCQDFLDECGIVQSWIAQFTGAGHVGAVKLFTQGACRGELHHRQIAGHFEGELVALFAIGLGRRARGTHHVGGDTVQLIQGHVQGEGVSGIQCVLTEFLAEFGLPLLNDGISLFGLALQICATQNKIAHRILVGLLLFGRQRGGVYGFVLGIEPFV